MLPKVNFKLCFLVTLIWAIIILAVNDSITNQSSTKNIVSQTSSEFSLLKTYSLINVQTSPVSTEHPGNKESNETETKSSTLKSTTPKKPLTFADCLNTSKSINLTGFTIQPKPCSNTTDLVWLIKSSIYRNGLRHMIRKFWGRESFGDEILTQKIRYVRRIFIVGMDNDNEPIPLLKYENEMYEDILQGKFPDTFSSVTEKVLTGMKFVAEFCPSTKFVVVVDDDAVVLPWNLFAILPDGKVDEFYGGFVYPAYEPIRDPNRRWYVSVDDFPCSMYPEYALGTLFILSYNTTVTFLSMVQNYSYFSMDDVFFGGLAKDKGISKRRYSFDHYTECGNLLGKHSSGSTKRLVVCHGADYINEQQILWSDFCYSATRSKEMQNVIILYCQNILH